MSDQDKNEEHAAPSSPAPMDTPTKGRGRGRGKGRGKRKPIAKPKVTTAVKKPIPTGRRGRIKQYNDPLVQAAYERQREVKTAYLSIISHVKPALEELASRNIDKLKNDSTVHKTVPEYRAIKGQLDARLAKVVDNAKEVLETKLDLIKRSHGKYAEFQELQYQNGVEDILDRFYDAQLERVRLLEEMHELGVAPDVRDNSYVYKEMSEKEYEERGVYSAYTKDGILAPYPSRVPGTDMYEKAQMMLAQYAPKPVQDAGSKVKRERDLRAAAIRGRLTGAKRRAQLQPDNQPGAKRPTTRSAARAGNDDDDADTGDLASYSEEPVNAPARHIMGILAAAVDNDGASESAAATPRASPDPDEDDKPDDSSGTTVDPRQRSLNRLEARPTNNRIAVKPAFHFDDIDIGFKDSTNDGSRIKNPAGRGKYLNTPNTNAFYYDPLLWNYDVRCQSETDLNQDLVERHALHPRYGFFIENSVNEQEPQAPICENPMPIILISPSGLTLHTCRSHTTTSVATSADNYLIRKTLEPVMREFVEVNKGLRLPKARINEDQAIPKKYAGPSLGLLEPAHDEEPESPLPVEEPEEESSPEPVAEVDDVIETPKALSALVNAAILASAEDTTVNSARAKSVSRPYDAIRDVFGSSAPTQPVPEPQPFHLALLAEICNWEPRPMQSQAQLAEDSDVPPRIADTARRIRYGQPAPGPPPPVGSIGPMTLDPGASTMPMPAHVEEDPYLDPRLRVPNPPPPQQHFYDQPPMAPHQPPGPYSSHPPPPMGMQNQMMVAGPSGQVHGQGPPPSEPLHYGGHRQPPPSQAPYHASSSPPLRPSTTGLPPLRPPRQMGHPQVFYTGPPTMPHPSMVASNAGTFYPPGPARPYHNSFPPPPPPRSSTNAWKGHVEKAAESKDGRGGYANKEDAEEAIF
ncbi:unnamed protein product [Parascedosporium putredinis]|uniref:Uncharacterized protein n=1 Tax=Parascedosporium putredinis TaxID=1442378 RepID=A0A9P1GWC5_9PEZI|nr:unnamed protein product [Parascedosporium putredinis]CAI7988659.1 unnamed protein product [Parascedosporium putredinis]